MLQTPHDTLQGASRPAAQAPHPDTDAQHRWVLETFGVNTRAPLFASASLTARAAPPPQAHAAGPAGYGRPSTPPALDPATQKAELARIEDPLRIRLNATLPHITETYETVRAGKPFVATYNQLNALLTGPRTGSPGEQGAIDALAKKAEAQITALEQAVAKLPVRRAAAAAEATRVNALPGAALDALGNADKVQIVKTLLAGGEPSAPGRAAQAKVYEALPLDPSWKKQDDARATQIAADLKGDPVLTAARKTWKTAPEADKVKAMQRVLAVQSKRLGIAPPELVIEHVPPMVDQAHGVRIIVSGQYSPTDGKLHINMDRSSSVQDFAGAIQLAIHENTHNYQFQLVDKLEAGLLKPGTPEYAQATAFAVNRYPGGYIEVGGDAATFAAYKSQPVERDAWYAAPATTAKILKGL